MFTAGGNLTVTPEGINAGAVATLEIDNSGVHTIDLAGAVLWSEGITDTISSGSVALVFQGLSIGTLAQIVGKDVQ